MNLLDIVTKGSTGRSVVLRIIDDTTGQPETGVVFNTSGIALWYRREGAAKTDITEATLASLTTAHADGGFLHIADGEYRLDVPDAAFATGANYVDVGGTVTGMIVIGGRVKLINVNYEDAVRFGATALPNANAEAAGGLVTRGTSAGQLSVSSGAVLLQPTQTGVTIPTVTTLTNAPSDSAGVTTLLSRIPSSLFAGITSLAQWLGAGFGKQTANSTARTEIRATGAGSGTFDETTDSLEGLRDADSAGVTTLLSRLSSARAGYLDNLNVGGNVASSSEVTAIQNNTRAVIIVPEVIERPDSETFSTMEYRVELFLYDTLGNMEAPDSAPTIALVNQEGTDRSGRLDSTTMANVSTGRYRAVYTASSADVLEQLVWIFSVVEGGATRVVGRQSLIVDTTAVDFTAADRTKLNTLHDTRLTSTRATALDNLDALMSSRATPAQVASALGTYDAPTKAELDAAVAPLATSSALAALAVIADAVKAVTDKIDTMVEADGGVSRYTTNALENAPAGGGGGGEGWSTGEREQIRHRLGIDGTAVAPSATPSLAAAAALVAAADAILAAVATRLAASSYAAPPTATQIADAYLDRADAIEPGLTPRGAMRLNAAADAGKVSGADTSQVAIRNVGDTKTRITADVDEHGNRTNVLVDVS